MADSAQDDKPTSATQAAKKKISVAVATLHEALQPYASKKAREYFSFHTSMKQYDGTIKKLSSNGFIPHSAQFKFTLIGSKRVSEGAEFAALKAESTAIVEEMQKKLQDKVRAAAELEGKELKNQNDLPPFVASVSLYSRVVLDVAVFLPFSQKC